MTDLEKRVYNQWLISSRTNFNKPFSVRKDFEGFEKDYRYPGVSKIAIFLTKFPDVNVEDFFNAPYKLYPDTNKPFDIDYFASRKAIKTYQDFLTEQVNIYTDSSENLKKCIESLKFIAKFCKEHNIEFEDYLSYKDHENLHFINHIRNKEVEIFSLIVFENFLKVYYSISNNQIEIPKEYKNIDGYVKRYEISSKLKPLMEEITFKLKNLKSKN